MLLAEDTTCMNNMTSVSVGSEGWQNFPRDEAKAGRFPTSIQLLEAQQIHVAMSAAEDSLVGRFRDSWDNVLFCSLWAICTVQSPLGLLHGALVITCCHHTCPTDASCCSREQVEATN